MRNTGKAISLFLIIAVMLAFCPRGAQAREGDTPELKINGARFVNMPDPKNPSVFFIEILGEGFGDKAEGVSIRLLDSGGAEAAKVSKIEGVTKDRIVAKVEAKLPVEIARIEIDINGKKVVTDEFEIALKPVSKQKPKGPQIIEIKFETFKSLRSAEEYSLFVTKVEGEGGSEFSDNPNHMRVEILPPGATDVRIRPGSNNEQLVIDFRAQENYQVRNVVITVYENGNLDERGILAIARPFKEKTPVADPNQPVISDAEILFLQRNKGFGRLKIEGRGFGQYDRPPLLSEDYRECCVKYADKIRAENNAKTDGSDRADKNTSFLKYLADSKSKAQSKSASEEEKKNLETIKGLESIVLKQEELSRSNDLKWKKWREKINEKVRLSLLSRNPDLRVDRTEILYIDDKLIDVYFEFTFYKGYSLPFRLAQTTLTVSKPRVKIIQTETIGEATVTVKGPDTFIAFHDVGPKRDTNLQYRYTVLDKNSANALFGRGVAENFYVIQLSVVNNGTKKIAVPLASIQAEIEWTARKEKEKESGQNGSGNENGESETFFLEGPPTISPIPLQAVSGFFDTYTKTKGKKAVLFNVLGGITQLGATMFNIFGPGFQTGHGIFSGGLVPALRTAVGDLSGQQLQNLTGLSWEGVEVLPPGGGSINKFIYIQRGEQFFAPTADGDKRPSIARKRIFNILGLEVLGFEVAETEAKQATQP
jgi:hypothetical protein